MNVLEVKQLVQAIVDEFKFEPIGLLDASGRILASSREAAALAKLVETELIQLLRSSLTSEGFVINEGGERAYPDIELIAPNDSVIALDIKCASYRPDSTSMNSRLTLYTFGTYLTHRHIKDGTLRPYDDYDIHLDLVAFYQVNPKQQYLIHENVLSLAQEDLQQFAFESGPFNEMYFCIVEPWRVASHRMSSGTRDYVGSIMDLERFRDEKGVFRSKEAFYNFWGNIPSQDKDTCHKIFGNSRKGITPSHCYIEQLSELLKEDVNLLYKRVLEDEAFPYFSPDPNTKFISIAEVNSIDEDMIFYPRVVFAYLELEPLVDGVEVELELAQILSLYPYT